MLTRKFWLIGLGLNIGVVVLVSLAAYLGWLETFFQVLPPGCDLIGHFVLIGLLGFFLDGALNLRPLLPGKWLWLRLAPVMMLVIGASEESAQAFSPIRTACVSDFLANALGILCGSWLAYRLISQQRQQRRRDPQNEIVS